ncbi:hypothetical protein HII28_02280 [Planctomonas sp. JC2975]|uniref:TM1812 family CRISPR-associated protein n=1 Tax=Planctomonas sp. JC2975 TaxID=2729626 RepID=UPI001472ADF9|nr:TM1812 family CRISPR-associated protein [Planctomonas sp. JC2975]NNC10715.1 hypothetical protein [Planctomonas sp. JC2975]
MADSPESGWEYETRRHANDPVHPNPAYRMSAYEFVDHRLEPAISSILFEENRLPWAVIDAWARAEWALRSARAFLSSEDDEIRRQTWLELPKRKELIEDVIRLMQERNQPLPNDFKNVLTKLYSFRNDFAHSQMRPVPDELARGVRFLRKLQWDRGEIVTRSYKELHSTMNRATDLMKLLTERVPEAQITNQDLPEREKKLLRSVIGVD